MNPLIARLQKQQPITDKDQQLITAAFETKVFKEGEDLFEAGHVCKQMFFICSGVVRIVMHNDKGNAVTYFFLKENQFCTILNSFINGVVANEGIVAACDVEVMAVSKSKLLALYEQLPYLKTLIDQITQQTLLDKINTRNTYLGHDSSARYQLFLERQPDIAMRVPLSDIASYLGVTPQSLSRIRKNIR